MRPKILNIVLFIIFIGTQYLTFSQKEVNVVTKTIKKDLNDINKALIINGEKSNINIISWDKNYYSVEVKLISKNLNKNQAETDLDIIKFEITENKDAYILKNFFASEKFGNIKSNLSVIFSIKLPNHCKVDITNIYGNVYFNNIECTGTLNNSFGEIHLNNIKGDYYINAYYSDMYVNDVDFGVKCTTDKSDIEMTNVSGKIRLKSNYGKLSFSPGKKLQILQVDAKRTTIFLNNFDLNSYNYSLSTINSKIVVPDNWKVHAFLQDGKNLFNVNSAKNKPTINVQTSYCQITVKNK